MLAIVKSLGATSATALTIAETNADNLFGISEDRAQLSGSCTKNQLITAGPIGSRCSVNA